MKRVEWFSLEIMVFLLLEELKIKLDGHSTRMLLNKGEVFVHTWETLFSPRDTERGSACIKKQIYKYNNQDIYHKSRVVSWEV